MNDLDHRSSSQSLDNNLPADDHVTADQEDSNDMQSQLIKIIEALQQHAKVCETAAEDSTEEARTGESCEKEKNMQDAKEWLIQSKVWLEAEEVVRTFAELPAQSDCNPTVFLPHSAPPI